MKVTGKFLTHKTAKKSTRKQWYIQNKQLIAGLDITAARFA